jgi:hypothetical protein
MNYIKYICILLPFLTFAQEGNVENDSTRVIYLFIKGDSIPKTSINLDEVMLLHRLKFDNKQERIRYLILRRKTLKVYPYAKLAAERLDSLTSELKSITKERHKKRHTKKVQKYIEGEFSDELKKLTRTEGQILVKLIHRQTGRTTFDLVKELRNGWRAFWYNTTASMFDISLKQKFDPWQNEEDYLIEDVLQRNFRSGALKYQPSALDINFFDLTDKWIYNKQVKPE